jgi:glycosyltransferase involved in cell wall biosynthesis
LAFRDAFPAGARINDDRNLSAGGSKLTPSVSIVIEWETALEGRAQRGVACLESICLQLRDCGLDVDVIVCFDPSEVDEAAVCAAVDAAARGQGWPRDVIVAPAATDYYGKKNFGFTLSRGEVVVFIDSDLVPEADWLRNLVLPFDDFRKSLVVGRTHLRTGTLYERAVALFWIFETREESTPLRVTQRLVSNNVAFRRPLFATFPFPERPTFRGQCSELASILAAHSIEMYEQPAARACHPAPNGARRFLARAFRAGGDQCFYDALERKAGLAQCMRNWRGDLAHVAERIGRRRRHIGANTIDVASAFVLGFVYYATKSVGYSRALWRGGLGLRSAASATQPAGVLVGSSGLEPLTSTVCSRSSPIEKS